MPIISSALLALHIFAGYLALSAGAASMLARKGQSLHRQTGKIFYYSMLGVSASAISLSLAKGIPFLLFVGIFVLYQNYSGCRALRHKSLRPNRLDWAMLAAAFVNALFMLRTMNIVLLVFGAITLLLAFNDLKTYRAVLLGRRLPKLRWLSRHIGMMTGVYIGTLTAFLVVNVQLQPYWALWLAPTAVFVPLMRYWTWKFAPRGA